MFRSARPLRRFLSTSLGTSTLGPRRPEGPVLTPIFLSNPPTPKEIVKHFDKHVIGQERAKQVVSVAIYNHYCRLFRHMLNPDEGAVLEKSNILLTGPSGTGTRHPHLAMRIMCRQDSAGEDGCVGTECSVCHGRLDSIH